MSNHLSYPQYKDMRLPLISRLAIFFAVFLITFIAVGALNGVLHNVDMNPRTRILVISALQSILVFVVPSIVAACLEFSKPLTILTLDKTPQIKNIIAVVICFIIGVGFLNQIIYWNETIDFSSSMSELEITLRKWENDSRELSDTILSDTTIGGLASGILIVGCLTGFAEELFFRAGLQRMLSQGMSGHAAIWIAAFIFSFMHFQFYGFIPRLLLGAFFGYLFVWSGSIWTSVFAHALNNCIVVFFTWLSAKGIIYENVEMLGVTKSGIPWLAILSGVFLFCFIYKFKGLFKSVGKQVS